ncbi:MAG TPA: gas vesicle protein GvpG [Candidatus Nesterenkonia stercoripullorum]|jgi:hypothetical protein|uniref:Gas vesicle protein GvpG n=1 Tax=Candidatus Nesterenkonia stercoripullorum TaxID=2838701 RepID=A0A9D1UT58_9MICC|nr:gas vesicle protein GvpG [Candidatus Nesterenkonia stercoripullorum]
MGLISSLVTAPFAPLRGTVWVAEQVKNEAERQYYDPGSIRRQLTEVEEARRTGALSEDEAARMEKELVSRLLESNRRKNS